MQQENAIQKTYRGAVIIRRIRQRKYGDAVEIVAKPLARLIDKMIGTDIEKCSKCSGRREKWNRRAFDTDDS
jgi:hypothetical protein